MKFFIIIFLFVSCAHGPKNIESYILNAEFFYNSKKVDDFEMIINEDQKATLEKIDADGGFSSVLSIQVNKSIVNGQNGLLAKLNLEHQSKKVGGIQTDQELFLKDGEEASFSVKTENGVLKTNIFLSKTVKKGADPKVCMATIYEAQKNYKRINKVYADKKDLIDKNIVCPESVKLTMTFLSEDEYIIVGSFIDVIWILTQDKNLIQAIK